MLILYLDLEQNKTPYVFHDYFGRADHHRATRADGRSSKVPRVNSETARREVYYDRVKIFSILPTPVKKVRFYLPFMQGLTEGSLNE